VRTLHGVWAPACSHALRGDGGGFGGAHAAPPPALRKLFDFKCDLTAGRSVTTMAWNAANDDVLAIAYSEVTADGLAASAGANTGVAASSRPPQSARGAGQPPHPPAAGRHAPGGSAPPSAPASRPGTAQGNASGGGSSLLEPSPLARAADDARATGGLVLFWSLRNPQFPERAIYTASGVTALACSQLIPNLVAVGLRDGTVAIYNLKREGPDLQVRWWAP